MGLVLPKRTLPPSESCIRELGALFGERCSTGETIREQHGRDESFHPSAPPDAVVFVESNEEVAEIMKLCVQHGTPIIPYGTGTTRRSLH